MEPHKFIISILIFGFFISGGLYIMFGGEKSHEEGLFVDYNVDMNSSKFDNLRDKIDETYNITSEQKDELSPKDVDTEVDLPFYVDAWRALIKMFKYFGLTGDIIQETGSIVGIPSFIRNFAAVVIMTIIVFMLVYMAIRFQPRKD